MPPFTNTPSKKGVLSQKLFWRLGVATLFAIVGYLVGSFTNQPGIVEVPPPPTNPDGTPLTPIPVVLNAPVPPPNQDMGHYEVAEINGQQVIKFRMNHKGDEVVFDTITGKVLYIKTIEGVLPTNDFPIIPNPKAPPPMPKGLHHTTQTWFHSPSM